MSFNRRQNQFLRERVVVPFTHAALTGSETDKFFKAPMACLVEKVEYINPTGLVADNSNAFKLEVKNGSTVVALVFNTDGNDSPAGASIAADTWADAVTPGSEANRTLAEGDVLSAVFTEDGTATLPAGTMMVHLLYL